MKNSDENKFSSLGINDIANYKDRFKSIHFKVDMAVAITSILLIIFNIWLVGDSMDRAEDDLMDDRLRTEIAVLKDEIIEHTNLQEGGSEDWKIRDGALYMGDTLIGDGTVEHAFSLPFELCQEMTGTFYYSFVRTFNDDELTEVEDSDHKYMQGHYMRIAGSVTGDEGERLEGTYIDKEIADALEASPKGTYVTDTNVNGSIIYTHYELIRSIDGDIVGILANGREVIELRGMIYSQQKRAFLIILIVMGIANTMLGVIVYSIVKSVTIIKERLDLIGTGEFPDEPLILNTDDELTDVAKSINQMVVSLKNKQRIEGELMIASGIQAQMLPNTFPAFPEREEFDIFAAMRPAKEVGGDFYDFFLLGEKNIAVVMADVSGKGVPAAMIMAIIRTLIKSYAHAKMSLSEIFDKVNRTMCTDNSEGYFVTAWMGVLNTETGVLNFVNAGHNPPLIRRTDENGEGQFEYLKMKPNFVLGGLEDIVYKEQKVQLKPGDKLLLYTDGVTEATSTIFEDELYGEARLKEALNRDPKAGVNQMIEAISQSMTEFIGQAEQYDDITVLALDYRKAYERQKLSSEKEFLALPESLEAVNTYVEEELDIMDCPDTLKAKIMVAVEEVFLNIANYAYGEGKGSMRLEILSDDENNVELVFKDRGIPFDPLAKKDPKLDESLEERNIGGLGIFMVKKIMDYVEYRYEDGQNIFTMRKKI